MSSAQVMSIIASVSGGHNGEVPGRQVFVEVFSDTEAVYSLVHWDTEADAPLVPEVRERYALTLVELPPLPPEEPEDEAATLPDEPQAE
ncbi:hypothetical protein SEA_BABYDOTZ_40 [Microbacterium phage BabyDotz]|nr:hypothetical protein SEA_BABYDOTZ_40 [Microbacterium phage BabyDotz]